MIEPSGEEVAGGHCGGDALEALGAFGGGEQLRCALIGEAVHADAAVGLRAAAKPCDGFGTVGTFVAERIERAFGAAAAADVLDDDVVAVACEPCGVSVDDGGGDVAPVGLAHEERGLRRVAGWIVVIGDQSGSVGELKADAALERDASAAVDTCFAMGRGGIGSRRRAPLAKFEDRLQYGGDAFGCGVEPELAVGGGGGARVAHDAAGGDVACEPCEVGGTVLGCEELFVVDDAM